MSKKLGVAPARKSKNLLANYWEPVHPVSMNPSDVLPFLRLNVLQTTNMNLISPLNSLLFRIIIGAIVLLYIILLGRIIRQISINSPFSHLQKIVLALIIILFPIIGLLFYYVFFRNTIAKK